MKKISFCFFNFNIFYFIFFFNLVISLVLCPILTLLFIYIFHFPKQCCFNGLDKWGLDAKSLIVQLVATFWYF